MLTIKEKLNKSVEASSKELTPLEMIEEAVKSSNEGFKDGLVIRNNQHLDLFNENKHEEAYQQHVSQQK